MLATVWQIFEYEAHTETEVMRISLNLFGKTREMTSSELIFGGLRPFGTTVRYLQCAYLHPACQKIETQ